MNVVVGKASVCVCVGASFVGLQWPRNGWQGQQGVWQQAPVVPSGCVWGAPGKAVQGERRDSRPEQAASWSC
jgi:hypothetical protein